MPSGGEPPETEAPRYLVPVCQPLWELYSHNLHIYACNLIFLIDRPFFLGWCLHVYTFPLSPWVPFSLTVGGLKSPWKGEYKEPRPPPQDQTTCHQTLPTRPRENPPAKANTDGVPEPQPPLPPEPPEPNKAPALNLSKEESGTWEPLPLSSLDPATAKGPSFPDRRATLPELELQQLEIGGRSAVTTPLTPPHPTPQLLYQGSSCRLCRVYLRNPVTPPTLHTVFLSPLPPAELFLNSLSQPFSLEEQEQILSCLSIDSLSLSDDSEKVSDRPACSPRQRP